MKKILLIPLLCIVCIYTEGLLPKHAKNAKTHGTPRGVTDQNKCDTIYKHPLNVGGDSIVFDIPGGAGLHVLDVQTFNIEDLLQIEVNGVVIFSQWLGGFGSFPGPKFWEVGKAPITYTQNPMSIPYWKDIPTALNKDNLKGLYRVTFTTPEGICSVKIRLISNDDSNTDWQVYVHCCDCQPNPPIPTKYIEQIVCDTTFTKPGVYPEYGQTKGGCDSTTITTIKYVENDPLKTEIIETCKNTLVTLEAPGGYKTYAWDDGTTKPVKTELIARDTSFSLTVTDAGGCKTRKKYEAKVLKSDTIVYHLTTCNQDSVGAYVRLYTNYRGCDSLEIDSITLRGVIPELATLFNVCKNTPLTFNAGDYLEYAWYDGSLNFEKSIIATQSKNYSVTVTDANNCFFQKNYQVDLYADPILDITSFIDTFCIEEREIRLKLYHDYLLEFSFDSLYSSITEVKQTGTHYQSFAYPYVEGNNLIYVRTVSKNGCPRDTVINLVFIDCKLYVPNAFSPNNDGYNDKFYPYADELNVPLVRSFKIYDRWGELVFEQYNFVPNDPSFGWDGTFNGVRMNPAVFVWTLEADFIIEGKVARILLKSGDVNLLTQ